MTILVGYAPRPESLAALNKALDIARSTRERVVVVNAGPGGEHRSANLLSEAQQHEIQQILDASGVQTEFRQYARGRSTTDEMKDVAAELDPSIVVIGLRRRGGFGRFVMGSVSDELLHQLDQPVLCVKEYTPAGGSVAAPAAEELDGGSAEGRQVGDAEPEPRTPRQPAPLTAGDPALPTSHEPTGPDVVDPEPFDGQSPRPSA